MQHKQQHPVRSLPAQLDFRYDNEDEAEDACESDPGFDQPDNDDDDYSSDGYDTVCDGEGDNDDDDETESGGAEDREEEDAASSTTGTSLKGALDRAIGELLSAQAVLDQLDSGQAGRSDQHRLNNVLNHSAVNSCTSNRPATSDNLSNDFDCEGGEQQQWTRSTEGESSATWRPPRPQLREVSEDVVDEGEGSDGESGQLMAGTKAGGACGELRTGGPQQRRQQLTTAEEDVIGQRLNACLRLLQGGPFQECDLCVRTLSTLLLYLQLTRRSGLSCAQLNQLGRLKRVLACLHGSSSVDRLRRLWPRRPPRTTVWSVAAATSVEIGAKFRQVGEHFRFVSDPLSCVPRVEPGDECCATSCRPASGRVSATFWPTLSRWDGYEDMLGRFRLATTLLLLLVTAGALQLETQRDADEEGSFNYKVQTTRASEKNGTKPTQPTSSTQQPTSSTSNRLHPPSNQLSSPSNRLHRPATAEFHPATNFIRPATDFIHPATNFIASNRLHPPSNAEFIPDQQPPNSTQQPPNSPSNLRFRPQQPTSSPQQPPNSTSNRLHPPSNRHSPPSNRRSQPNAAADKYLWYSMPEAPAPGST
uniref:Myb-like domain-containing protein n=1 Tax=Macrostomum lignano TaxID=282301 RepID=A0A1I8JMK5_9PLAT